MNKTLSKNTKVSPTSSQALAGAWYCSSPQGFNMGHTPAGNIRSNCQVSLVHPGRSFKVPAAHIAWAAWLSKRKADHCRHGSKSLRHGTASAFAISISFLHIPCAPLQLTSAIITQNRGKQECDGSNHIILLDMYKRKMRAKRRYAGGYPEQQSKLQVGVVYPDKQDPVSSSSRHLVIWGAVCSYATRHRPLRSTEVFPNIKK